MKPQHALKVDVDLYKRMCLNGIVNAHELRQAIKGIYEIMRDCSYVGSHLTARLKNFNCRGV